MHPPLFKPHPKCEDVVKALVACHEDHSIRKFFGHCNQYKAALDKCFNEEKDERRHANMMVARENRARYEAKRDDK
jgi:COX assembly mitochondrial protein 2